jgi:hypothetical protein
MASLDNGHNAVPRFEDVPGADQTVGIWLMTMLSASDTVTVPALATRSGTNDFSSAIVLEPGTGVTVNAADFTANNENVLTLAGAAAGDRVILVTLHRRGFHNALAVPAPA